MPRPKNIVRRKPGRPKTGITPIVGLRLSNELTAAIDAWGESHQVTRSEAIRRLVELTLTKNPANAPADAEFIAAVDAWADANDVPRVDAIRRLVELGLKGARK